MARSLTRSHLLILPLVILAVVLFEEIAEYQARRLIDDVYLRTAVIMALYALGFSFAFEVLSPRLKSILVALRKGSRKQAGKAGIWLFFLTVYALAYAAYLQLERHGPASLLPDAWR